MKASRQPVYFVLLVSFLMFVVPVFVSAQQNAPQIDPKTYGGMKWRLIGPFRGGRVLAVTGVTSQPNTYYFGAVAGGVWKTTDGGVIWTPLSDGANWPMMLTSSPSFTDSASASTAVTPPKRRVRSMASRIAITPSPADLAGGSG